MRKYAFSIFGIFVDVCTLTFEIRIIFNSDNGGTAMLIEAKR